MPPPYPPKIYKPSTLKMRCCQKLKDHIMAPAGFGRTEIQCFAQKSLL